MGGELHSKIPGKSVISHTENFWLVGEEECGKSGQPNLGVRPSGRGGPDLDLGNGPSGLLGNISTSLTADIPSAEEGVSDMALI